MSEYFLFLLCFWEIKTWILFYYWLLFPLKIDKSLDFFVFVIEWLNNIKKLRIRKKGTPSHSCSNFYIHKNKKYTNKHNRSKINEYVFCLSRRTSNDLQRNCCWSDIIGTEIRKGSRNQVEKSVGIVQKKSTWCKIIVDIGLHFRTRID